jgi:AraC-like DNA-binding protein
MEEILDVALRDGCLRQFGGASLRRVVDRSSACVAEHAHDWPVLSLFVLGAYRNQTELGEVLVAGPSALLYSARAAHRNTIAQAGFEQIEIEFDPAWLGRANLPELPVSRWIGGRAGAEARRLVRLCLNEPCEDQLRVRLRQFLQMRRCERRPAAAPWLETIGQRLARNPALRASDLAREMKRHPSWLGFAYRQMSGETLPEASARHRVERAARSLRETDRTLADIAADAGFCDQSHMNRTFKRILARTPLAVRADRNLFRNSAAQRAMSAQPNVKE